MSLHESLNRHLFVVRRVGCGCVVAASDTRPSRAEDVFLDYESSTEYEICIEPNSRVALATWPCPHVAVISVKLKEEE